MAVRRFIALAAVSSVVLGGCRTPEPEIDVGQAGPRQSEVSAQVVGEIPEAPSRKAILEGPTFTPFTEAPSLLNREEVAQAVRGEYPEHLRDAGVSGTVRVYFLLDDEGEVLRRVVHETSGHEELDAAALRAARAYRFSAARNRGQAVYVWVSLPITFTVR